MREEPESLEKPEEERGFDYIIHNLRNVKNSTSEDEKLRKESCKKSEDFFRYIVYIAAREADSISL